MLMLVLTHTAPALLPPPHARRCPIIFFEDSPLNANHGKITRALRQWGYCVEHHGPNDGSAKFDFKATRCKPKDAASARPCSLQL